MEASFGSKPAGFGTPDCGPKPLWDLLQGLPIASRQIFWDSFYHQPKPTNSIPKLTRFDRFDKGEAFLDEMNFATVISGMACPFWSNTSGRHLNHANWPWVIFGQSNVETRRPNGSVLRETTWFQNPWEKLISFDQKLERQKYSIGYSIRRIRVEDAYANYATTIFKSFHCFNRPGCDRKLAAMWLAVAWNLQREAFFPVLLLVL